MSLTLRIGLIVLSLIFIVYVFNNVNKRKLQLQFSLIWLLIALAIIIIAVFPQIVYFAAKFIGPYCNYNPYVYFNKFDNENFKNVQ